MSFWNNVLVSVFVLAMAGTLGYCLAEFRQRYGRREGRRTAASAIRFESESNLRGLLAPLETQNWFRDDAFVDTKVKGYIADLPRPLPDVIATTYSKLYHVNRLMELARSGAAVPQLPDEVERLKWNLEKLNTTIDVSFPDIGRNFGN